MDRWNFYIEYKASGESVPLFPLQRASLQSTRRLFFFFFSFFLFFSFSFYISKRKKIARADEYKKKLYGNAGDYGTFPSRIILSPLGKSVAVLFLIFLVLDARISFSIVHSSGRRNIPSRKFSLRYFLTCSSPVFEYFIFSTLPRPRRYSFFTFQFCRRCTKNT